MLQPLCRSARGDCDAHISPQAKQFPGLLVAQSAALLQDVLPHTAPPPHLPRWKKGMPGS